MKHPFSRSGLALVLCSGMLLAACSDDDDTPSAPSSPAPVEPSPTPSPSAAPEPSPPPTSEPQPGESVAFLGKLKTNVPPLLKIGGQDVMVDERTTYARAGTTVALSDIAVGEVVRVRGNYMDDRTTVLATRIAVPPPDGDDNP